MAAEKDVWHTTLLVSTRSAVSIFPRFFQMPPLCSPGPFRGQRNIVSADNDVSMVVPGFSRFYRYNRCD